MDSVGLSCFSSRAVPPRPPKSHTTILQYLLPYYGQYLEETEPHTPYPSLESFRTIHYGKSLHLRCVCVCITRLYGTTALVPYAGVGCRPPHRTPQVVRCDRSEGGGNLSQHLHLILTASLGVGPGAGGLGVYGLGGVIFRR